MLHISVIHTFEVCGKHLFIQKTRQNLLKFKIYAIFKLLVGNPWCREPLDSVTQVHSLYTSELFLPDC